jgi:enoyl-CoA hydratase/carnithine racemase
MPLIEYGVENNLAYITIDRPTRKNALNHEVFDHLSDIWRGFSDDDTDRRMGLLDESFENLDTET